MTCTVLLGDDDSALRGRRADLAEASGASSAATERHDAADLDTHPLILAAVTTPSMFGEPRYVEIAGAEHLTEELAAALGRTPDEDTVVVWGPRLSASAKKTLPDTVTVETHRAGPGGSRDRVRALAGQAGVTLTASQLEWLDRTVGHDLPRVASIVSALAAAGHLTPDDAVVQALATSPSARPSTPWAVADALADGDVGLACHLAEGCEPLAVTAYLGTRLGQYGRVLETGLDTPGQVASALGVTMPAATRLLEQANRVGQAGVAASWRLLAASDVAIKRAPDQRHALTLTLVRMGRLWTPVHA